MTHHILSIDQGTTSSRAFLIDHDLNVKGEGQYEFPQIYPKPGWVEHNAEDIWGATLKAIHDCLAKSKIDPKNISAVGITNQRETTVLWNKKTGQPLGNAIVWQDRRTTEHCAELKKQGYEKKVHEKTGLVLDPYFSATKIEWMLKNNPEAKRLAEKGELAFGTIDSFLVWRLSGGKAHVTDATNASRTLLMNLKTLQWDSELLEIFNIPESILPKIVSCSEIYRITQDVPGLPDGIPIAGMAGDQQAALIGQACFAAGEAKCTYGTGSFILMNIGKEPKLSKHRLLTTLAYNINREITYAWEGSSFIAGAAVQWLRDGLKIIKKSSDVETLALQVPDSGEIVFVPALVGLGAPHWRPEARGVISGITRGTTAAHIARATLEGIAFSQYDILESMTKDLGRPLAILKVDGGASANNLLMQFQSDILQVSIQRPVMKETTVLGAAFLAGMAVGLWKNPEEIRKSWREEKQFTPKMSSAEVDAHVQRWQRAILKA
ncbi:MAG: glycerol kinase GlpK [Deltaproteobacteria bacterium]|nr:glycerol kinase GlpK [Deltaproteobacteria bacterium]